MHAPAEAPKPLYCSLTKPLSADASAADTAPALFVGTSDGRMLLLRIVLERGNGNVVTCTVLHDVPVVHGAAAAAASPVAVLALRDKAVAVVSYQYMRP